MSTPRINRSNGEIGVRPLLPERPLGCFAQKGPDPFFADAANPFSLVVDVGNTRIKWGLCNPDAVIDLASLAPDDPAAWQQQLDVWKLQEPLTWAVSGVHPPRRDRLIDWLRQRGDTVLLISAAEQLPLGVAVEQPDKVGIDRLLNAVAVNAGRNANTPAFVVDAGSAVTVDFLDEQGVFRGGAILPGLGLMAKALHEHTALLPLVEVDSFVDLPGTSTVTAMKAGIFLAVLGGIKAVIDQTVRLRNVKGQYEIYFSGGDAPKMCFFLSESSIMFPNMTLEGLRIAALYQKKK